MGKEQYLGSVGGKLGTVVVGGGTGFVGSTLTKHLRKKGYNVIVVSRNPGPYTITWTQLEKDGLPDCKAVVNVAGQNVLDPTKRWTPGFKQNVWASRVNTTKSLAAAMSKMNKKPEVFVTISGVGFYPPSPTTIYTEESPGGDYDFLSRLCTEWEKAAASAPPVTRKVTIRSGVVLGRSGGMIKQTILPFFFGAGGPVGSGKQWMPWIHVGDTVGLFIHAIENENVKGILNGVAPQMITNAEFAKAFATALKRPAFVPLPIPILNLLFNEERAKIMTEGQKVMPKRTLETGYQFKYPDIKSACKEFAVLVYKNEY